MTNRNAYGASPLIHLSQARQSTGTIHEIFEAAARDAPAAKAVHEGGRDISYRQLHERAVRIADALRAHGVGAESIVALSMSRSLDAIATMIGVLKAGGAYLPLDPAQPEERNDRIVRSASISLMICEERRDGWMTVEQLLTSVADRSSARSAQAHKAMAEPQSLAYLIHTSGSTGEPKGVAVTHENVVSLLQGAAFADLGPDARVLHLASPAFDAATFEIWGALLNGGCVHVVDRDDALSAGAIAAIGREHPKTTAFFTTALFNRLVSDDAQVFGDYHQILFGGEAVNPQSVRRLIEGGAQPHRLIHVYGPTETVTFSTAWPIAASDGEEKAIPVGQAIQGRLGWAVDDDGDIVTVGDGELWIGGAGVARGYYGKPGQTADRFVPNPFGPAGTRLYRTGDWVGVEQGNVFTFHGRRDQQVKLSGFRVELGEVEAALAVSPGVTATAVTVQEAGDDKRLCAFVVLEPGRTVSAIRRHLRDVLPDYMMPNVFMVLKAIPLTASGKLDKSKLVIVRGERDLDTPFVEPSTPLQHALVEIWCEALDVDQVGIEDDFFDLGGHSLLVMRVVAMVRSRLGVEIPLRTMFEAPTISDMARDILARLQA